MVVCAQLKRNLMSPVIAMEVAVLRSSVLLGSIWLTQDISGLLNIALFFVYSSTLDRDEGCHRERSNYEYLKECELFTKVSEVMCC